MRIVEYLDPKTEKGLGKYAKRTIDPVTGIISDEIIPKKCFCVCDSTGKILSITEVNFSHAIEVEGKAHCVDLKSGEECNRVLDAEMPTPPKAEKDKLKWILDNHKMGTIDESGRRKIVKKAVTP